MNNPNQIPKSGGPAGWAPGVMDPPPPYSASSGPYPQSSIPHQGPPTGYPQQQPQGFPQGKEIVSIHYGRCKSVITFVLLSLLADYR